ncbi:histidine kinase [Pedobacter sp. HDW13]|uniref:histidine kinase n=1 Tax=Pedobacter sp. HDW13 TaxID=2714940 RepID=UPI0014086005|nr:sensor histidine kinase [Pedobacter sp. HDW13]QIL42251.1 histidine kinase [Pedobacter sp. HDW13]
MKNSNFKHWLINYKVHLIVWLIFITWETIVVLSIGQSMGKFVNFVVHYPINIFLFYINVWVLEKATAFSNQSFWKVILFVTLEIFIYVTFVLGLDNMLNAYTSIMPGPLLEFKIRLFKLINRGSYFMIFSTSYFFLKRYITEKAEKQRIEKQRFQMLIDKERMDKELVMAKNAFLKAQINPHLLFNTFEFIHQKIRQHSPEDAQVMVYLSDMMRFAAATEHNEGYVKLSDEITQCQNLIKLHQLTQGQVFIEVAFSPDVLELRLIPLVLLTLLENMFKHGHLFDQDNKATIDAYMVDGILRIESRNLPGLVKSNIGFGSGLDNIRTRLDYTYGNGAEMNAFMDEDGFYCLSIAIREKALAAAFDTQQQDLAINYPV